MRDSNRNSNINNISGNTFNGPTNIFAGNTQEKVDDRCTYIAEPVWRSSVTMAVLTWIGTFIALAEIFPLYKILEPLLLWNVDKIESSNAIYVIIVLILLFLLMIIWQVRNITKTETRYPLLFNYAISGEGKRITIEKIKSDNCPKCGGKMKYYNKPVEWIDKVFSNGKTKREVTMRKPVLECKRNSEHYYFVDPAEKIER